MQRRIAFPGAAVRCSKPHIKISRLSTYTVASLLASPNAAAEYQNVTVNGFVRSVRRQKQRAFVVLGDGSSYESIQAVVEPDQAQGLSTGVGVTIRGQWRPSPGKQQACELSATDVRIAGQHDASNYPLQKKYHSPEYLRTLPHLRQRLPFNSLLLRLRSQIIASFNRAFTHHGFVQTHPPIITSSDCEGAGEAFTLNPQSDSPVAEKPQSGNSTTMPFFRSPKYLTVSSQLHLEAMAQAVGKAWTLSPTFRAEKSDTPRHLSEFYMLEAEFCFVQDLSGVMDLVETLLRSVTRELQQSTTGQELLLAQKSKTGGNEDSALTPESLEQRWSKLVQSPWPRISYVEAINILQDAAQPKSANFTFQPTYESGLQAEHEKYLAQHVGEGGPVFVTDYPAVQKPFYMSQSGSISEKDASPTVACFDLLVPDICEIVGGSMREDDLERLLKAMQRQGMKLGKEYQQILEPGNTEAYETAPEVGSLDWYADLRRFGSVPHGGFGLGFDRLLCYLAGVSSIRDMVSFPRWYGRCDC